MKMAWGDFSPGPSRAELRNQITLAVKLPHLVLFHDIISSSINAYMISIITKLIQRS
jgi:hypothetical protein